MGCDIHCYLEVKPKGSSEWKEISLRTGDGKRVPVYNGRNYFLFGKLAGVRSDCDNPLAVNRGLPEDISEKVRKESEYWVFDGHNFSWVDVKELDVFKEDDDFTYLLCCANYVLDAYRCFDGESRLVFWFDN